MTIRPATQPEQMYCYTQSAQIMSQTGCIGHLRGDMDTNGKGFFTSWEDHTGHLKTDLFKEEFDQVINALRNDIQYDGILKDRSSLAHFCYSHPAADIGNGSFGYRADTDQYAYLCRLNPNKGEYNFYIYAYRKDWLDQHLRNAERGIRFIDSRYNNKFRIPDGGKIRITFPDSTNDVKICRYIDEYHLEIGSNVYHICEFAERTEQNGCLVEPVTPPMLIPQRKEKPYAGIDR